MVGEPLRFSPNVAKNTKKSEGCFLTNRSCLKSVFFDIADHCSQDEKSELFHKINNFYCTKLLVSSAQNLKKAG